MCGRFVSREEATIARCWNIGRHSNPNPFARRFNVFPTDTIPFLRLPSSSDELEDNRKQDVLDFLRSL